MPRTLTEESETQEAPVTNPHTNPATNPVTNPVTKPQTTPATTPATYQLLVEVQKLAKPSGAGQGLRQWYRGLARHALEMKKYKEGPPPPPSNPPPPADPPLPPPPPPLPMQVEA